jgi:mannose-1-phosphate guanylyltransferase
MKAFLLAAGRGTRLQPVTFHTPKCLVPINGRPLLEYWFDLLERYGVQDILINTSHLAGKVRHYTDNHARHFMIKHSHEKSLLGSGGTIKRNWDYVRDENCFFVLYADNLTNINLQKMLAFHNSHKKDFTLTLVRVPNPGECGIVELGRDSSVVSFMEKPEKPVSDLAFAGIMLCSRELKHFFPRKKVFDLGYDVLPKLAGKAAGYVMPEYLLDIGTPDKLIQAEEDIKNGKLTIQYLKGER